MNDTKFRKNCTPPALMENTDVIENFDYSGQSDEYVKIYKKWRKNPDNPYSYNYSSRKNEITFNDSMGFLNIRPEEKEQEVLMKLLYTFGAVLILYLFTEYVISTVLVAVLDKTGVNIHNSFLNYSVYGGQKEVMSVMIFITLMKFCIPTLILHKKLKMPLKAALPCRLQSTKNLFFCISLSIIASVMTSIPRTYSDYTREYFRFFNGYSNEISLMNQSELIIYMFFDIVIVSIINEILFRGAVFQALRQFGDLYAVIVTSSISALLTHDISSIPAAFAVSAVAAISILRSGTMFTAIAVQIINKIYLFSLTIIELSVSDSDMMIKRGYFMIICFLISLVIALILWGTMNREFILKRNLSTFLTSRKKISITIFNLPTFTVIFLCLMIIITNILI